MRCIIFGDESSVPGMIDILGEHFRLAVVASNRPQSINNLSRDQRLNQKLCVQPIKKSKEYDIFLTRLRKETPDYFFCFSYSLLLDRELLDIPRSGAINFHGGLLPKFRGANIYNWVLIEGAEESGMTAHYMTDGIDDGDIILQEKVKILATDTAKTLKEKIDPLGLDLLKRIKYLIEKGQELPRTPQNQSKSGYYRRRHPEDGLIDWTKSDREIFNLIRALVTPWPGAFYYTKSGQKVIVSEYQTIEDVKRIRKENGF
jgi:methionyl-tRNA formyltransferase